MDLKAIKETRYDKTSAFQLLLTELQSNTNFPHAPENSNEIHTTYQYFGKPPVQFRNVRHWHIPASNAWLPQMVIHCG